jgi:flagellar protein FliS
MGQRQIAAKGESLSKAIAIIENGLKASLDIKAGGVLGDHLAALYDYMGHRLLIANLHNRIEIIDEVSNLLGELRGAWAQIKSPAQTAATTAANGPTYSKA